jgi:hypothetical protein
MNMTNTPIHYIIQIIIHTSLFTKNETKTTGRGYITNLTTHIILYKEENGRGEMNWNECK